MLFSGWKVSDAPKWLRLPLWNGDVIFSLTHGHPYSISFGELTCVIFQYHIARDVAAWVQITRSTVPCQSTFHIWSSLLNCWHCALRLPSSEWSTRQSTRFTVFAARTIQKRVILTTNLSTISYMPYPEIVLYPIMNTHFEHTITSEVRINSSVQYPNYLFLCFRIPRWRWTFAVNWDLWTWRSNGERWRWASLYIGIPTILTFSSPLSKESEAPDQHNTHTIADVQDLTMSDSEDSTYHVSDTHQP